MHHTVFIIAIAAHYVSIAAGLVLRSPGQVEALLDTISVTNIDNVRSNLHIPDELDAVEIAWSSSDPAILTADGVVFRQSTDVKVTLTATINSHGRLHQREFKANVRKACRAALDYEAYAFLYFTGNTIAGEKIYLAASKGNDALQWNELNNAQPILASSQGTKGLRDPFIIRSPEGDTFYLLATDLSIGSGTSWDDSVRSGSLYLEIWESNDLISWSQQRHVLVSPPTAGNTWAPEAYYDTAISAYVVFWASDLYNATDTAHTGTSYERMLISTTRDFVTFSTPEIWQDAGTARIDSTVIEEDGIYYRFTKDEGSVSGCTDIIQESSSVLLSNLTSWSPIATCIGRKAGTSAVEGPTSFKANPNDVNGQKYYLFVDEYTDRGYIPLETLDIANPSWAVSSSYSLPASPRHGTVIPITAAELAAITEHYGIVNSSSSTNKRSSTLSKRISTVF